LAVVLAFATIFVPPSQKIFATTCLPTEAGPAASQLISTTQLPKLTTRQPFTLVYCPKKWFIFFARKQTITLNKTY
jgi:hypothetical protein